MTPAQPPRNPLARLRQFVRPRPAATQFERCALCGQLLPHDHPHLLELASRQLACSCQACALLFQGQPQARYRPIPRTRVYLPDFQLSDAEWEQLHIPINLAFFVANDTGKIQAFYPSPAGATETQLPLEAWPRIVARNPVLQQLEPEVEALLVQRIGNQREHYRVSIDACYHLVGTIRARWSGLSGGREVWEEVARFFTHLRQTSG
jgi:hypothetical protein